MVFIEKFQKWEGALVLQATLSVLLLLGVICYFQPPFWKDEVSYLGDALSFQRLGWSQEFLKSLVGPPGPLYGFLHGSLGFSAITPTIWVRLFNLILYILYAAVILRLFTRIEKKLALTVTALLFAVPFNYPVLATALTEAPAYLFQALSLMFLYFYIDEESENKKLLWTVLTAVCFAIAFSGRQTTAAVAIGLIYFLWIYKPKLYHIAVFALVALPIPIYLMIQWDGVMAGSNAYLSSGVSLFHLALSFGYLGFCYFLFNPIVLKKDYLKVIIGALIFMVLGFFIFPDNRMPLQNTVRDFLPVNLWPIYAKLSCSLLAYLGLLMLYYILQQLRHSLAKEKLLFALFVGPILTPLWITHMFSGRYVSMITPMIIYFAVRNTTLNGWFVARCLMGTTLGLVATFKYYSLF